MQASSIRNNLEVHSVVACIQGYELGYESCATANGGWTKEERDATT
jgi:hypothetical protein